MSQNFLMKIDMQGIDAYYTPSALADKLVGFVKEEKVETIIDFCVGDGGLLKAAGRRFQKVNLYGTDISCEAIRNLSLKNTEFNLSVCDFRDDNSITDVGFLNDALFDLVLLNPPFTCKGSIIERIELDGVNFKVSTAMYFLIKSLRFLSATGGVYAIMPISSIYSEKDRRAWEYLKSHYNACVLEESIKVAFSRNCSPNIAFVFVGRSKRHGLKKTESFLFRQLPVTYVVRGQMRMGDIEVSSKRKAVRLIHTTNMQQGKLVKLRKILADKTLASGYGVVIPRVCNPNKGKICILDGLHSYVLSDCVMLLGTKSMQDAEIVRHQILSNWEEFKTIYKGTGAQYTTLSRVKKLLGIIN